MTDNFPCQFNRRNGNNEVAENQKMENGELILRQVRPEDAAELLAIYAPYVEQTAITFEYVVPTVEEFQSRICSTLKKYPYLVAERAGEILGYAYAGEFKSRAAYAWNVEVSIYIKQGMKRMGLGRLLYAELERLLKAQGVLNLYACIAYPKEEDEYLTKDSVRFHERQGYRLIGTFSKCGYKFNRWYDMVWMEKLVGEHLEEQPPVVEYLSIGTRA